MYATRNSLLAALCLSAGAMLAPLTGTASTYPTEAPPPNQEERTPPPKLGVIWDAGHWDWNGSGYVWRQGAWRDARPGFHWVPDRWEQVGEQWHHVAGHWEH
jgi:hypothetical protein